MAGQWVVTPQIVGGPAGSASTDRYVGLDYARVEAGLRLAGIEVTPEIWGQVQQIEAGARAGLNGVADDL